MCRNNKNNIIFSSVRGIKKLIWYLDKYLFMAFTIFSLCLTLYALIYIFSSRLYLYRSDAFILFLAPFILFIGTLIMTVRFPLTPYSLRHDVILYKNKMFVSLAEYENDKMVRMYKDYVYLSEIEEIIPSTYLLFTKFAPAVSIKIRRNSKVYYTILWLKPDELREFLVLLRKQLGEEKWQQLFKRKLVRRMYEKLDLPIDSEKYKYVWNNCFQDREEYKDFLV